MSHIPFRSKRCINCQRRKKGCDMKTPSCGQCIRAGIACEGYGPRLAFVDPSAARQKILAKRAAAVVAPSSTDIALKDSLARTARDERFMGIFWDIYLPNGQRFSPEALRYSPGGWTNTVIELHHTEPALHYAIKALAYGAAASQEGSLQLRLKATQMHSRALVEMRKAMDDPSHYQSDAILAAVRLFQYFELFFGSFGEQWKTTMEGMIAHIRGQINLIFRRGPESFVFGRSHEMFVDSRTYLAIITIQARGEIRLATEDWLTTPWKAIEKQPKDKLTDILLEIGACIKRMDALRALDNVGYDSTNQLLTRALRVKNLLDTWSHDYQQQMRSFDYTASPYMPLFIQHDSDIALVYLSMVYWCTCIFVDTTVEFVSQLRDEGHKPEEETAIKILENSKIYAYKIARCAHLIYSTNAGVCHQSMARIPIVYAIRLLAAIESPAFPSFERQTLEILNKSDLLGGRLGGLAEVIEDDMVKRHLESAAGLELRKAKAKALAWWAVGLASRYRKHDQQPVR